MLSFAQTGRTAAIVLAAGLLAAACGAEEATVEASTDAGSSEGSTPAAVSESESTDQSDQPSETPAPAADDQQEAAPEPAIPHEFPDLGTVNIVDGSAVNLAQELAGGDTPVFLWFFAPH